MRVDTPETPTSNFVEIKWREYSLDYGFHNFETSSISKGTTFTFHKQKYKTAQKLFYTHALNSEVSKKVDENTLEITNEKGTVIASYPLKKVGKNNHAITMKNDVKASSIVGDYLSGILLLVCIIVLGIAGMLYRKKRKI
uniref:Uncharacterized protein n=1 Tax=Virgibacillus oceani TaxID=1479511 RepID=A0A917HQC9_9BACI|nr:hypothetical protein GCM10011398_36350 [Virgibacillus oceani]